jgi:outer membrane protein assembly factor BamB
MQLRKLLLPGLLSVTLLSGCSLFSGEEDVVTMSPLPTVENQFTPSTAWSTSVGNGIGDFYSNLHPAYADSVVYAADRKGTVKALNADDGKEYDRTATPTARSTRPLHLCASLTCAWKSRCRPNRWKM